MVSIAIVAPGGDKKEAPRVREIFRLYQERHSLTSVLEELQRRRWTTKSWTTKNGSRHAGHAFTEATLVRLLTNAVYLGKVEHKGALYEGEHPAIVEPEAWEQVNGELRAHWRGEHRGARTPQDALLKGLLYCAPCARPMAVTYTAHGGRRYRYYVCLIVTGC